MSEFFTWTNLATIAGATAATAYIVQFLKRFSCFNKLNQQAVSYGVSLLILFLATYFTGNLTASTGVMLFFNAVIVAFSSNGVYDSVKSTLASNSDNKISASDTTSKSEPDKTTANSKKVDETDSKASDTTTSVESGAVASDITGAK